MVSNNKDVDSVEILLEQCRKGRPLSYMEIVLKLKDVKSEQATARELSILVKRKKVKKIKIKQVKKLTLYSLSH